MNKEDKNEGYRLENLRIMNKIIDFYRNERIPDIRGTSGFPYWCVGWKRMDDIDRDMKNKLCDSIDNIEKGINAAIGGFNVMENIGEQHKIKRRVEEIDKIGDKVLLDKLAEFKKKEREKKDNVNLIKSLAKSLGVELKELLDETK